MLQNSSDGDNSRFLMWEGILGANFNYWTASGGEKKRLKRAFAAALGTQPHNICEDGLGYYMKDTCDKISMEDFDRARAALKASSVPMGSLDCCDAPCKPAFPRSHSLGDILSELTNNQIKKEKKMRSLYNDCSHASTPTASVNINADSEFSLEKEGQERLLNRSLSAFSEKRRELEKTYHLYDSNAPETVKDLLDRLKAGDYKFDKDYKEEYILSREFDHYDNPFRHFDWRKDLPDQAGYDAAYKLLDEAHDELVDTIKVLGAKEGLTAFRAFEAQSFSVN